MSADTAMDLASLTDLITISQELSDLLALEDVPQKQLEAPAGTKQGRVLEYWPLDHQAHEIRLLTILDSDDDSHVKCIMDTVSMNDAALPEYSALSYPWGDIGSTVAIAVNKCDVEVTANLHAAMKQLRLRGYQRVWIDALCVNQLDREERGRQVQLMRQIYGRAIQVITWVGDADDDTAEAVKFLLERSSQSSNTVDSDELSLTGFESVSRPVTPVLGSDRWRSRPPEERHDSPRYSRLEKAKRRWIRNQWSIIQDFFSQEYWKRVWVIQEVAVATDLKVLYGSSEISWANVATAIVLWKETLMSLPTGHLPHLYPAQLLDLRTRFSKQVPISLFHALMVSNQALSTDPRDKIFALLGLTFDGPILVPNPNYKSSLGLILADLTRAMIVTERSLDLICIRSIYPPVEERIPSWIPPWFNNPSFSFWSNPMTILENHLLAKIRTPQEAPLLVTTDPNVLLVKGVILDEVCSLSSALGHRDKSLLSGCHLDQCSDAQQEILQRNIAKFYPSYGPINALWQALCMEHAFHRIREPGQYYSSRLAAKFQSCFVGLWAQQDQISFANSDLHKWLNENGSMQIGLHTLQEWSAKGKRRDRHSQADFDTFCGVLLDVLRSSMRLFVTNHGYLGMAPSQTRRGDRIAFLKGCSVPVVLRGNSVRGHEVVGCCSVRTKFEPYAEACKRFAAGEVALDSAPRLNITDVRLV